MTAGDTRSDRQAALGHNQLLSLPPGRRPLSAKSGHFEVISIVAKTIGLCPITPWLVGS